ncbi:hypothetical protein E3N88_04572 [Mikania micrantha]|uniref:MULE transposase domain-containing protein n=1 Tax=Mikania micrantha TaxID=192012 RepID=A0A5N6PUU4_9ASTR|nr:hypothetical protein E3N88_04572 [Mikania micrantha]
MGGGDQPLILADCSLEETENLLSPVVREAEPNPLNVDIFDILTGDSPLRYIVFDQQGCHSSFVYQTPNGSRYWSPNVSSQFKPIVGNIFLSWDEVYKMYETYGEMSGFQIRVAGYKKWKGEITHRVLGRCNCSTSVTNFLERWSPQHACTRNSYKNVSRDIRMFIGERDVQLAIFWADDVSKLSYQLFGDVIAFDATYSTNKYNMIFVPFTGVDNHKRCVTFGADLIHNSNIRSRLHKLVWNVCISTTTLEEKWHNLMAEYALENHIGLNEMFSIRELWVPCYFRDIPMCCLMKTTSRCESSNSMFNVTSGSTNTLVQFLMCFDTTIDNQRYNQRVVDFKSKSTTCVFKTGLELEVHAAKIYTQTIFKDVQKDIYKCMINCVITNFDVDNFKVYTVSHMDNRSDFVNHFKVSVHMLEHSYECSCMGFTRVGYLYHHVFCVFRLHQIKNIPDRYISNRWRKGSLPSHVYSISQRLSVDNSKVSIMRNEVADCLSECVDHLALDVDGLSFFNQKMKELKRELVDNFPGSSSSQKKQCVIEHLVGQHHEDTIDLLPPHCIRNKGCGTNRRLVGPGEKAIENSKKNLSMCRSCNQLTFHDSCNCKKKANVGESTSEK